MLRALLRKGWQIKRQRGSHKTLAHSDFDDFVFSFGEYEEIGKAMLSRIAKKTGLKPGDL